MKNEKKIFLSEDASNIISRLGRVFSSMDLFFICHENHERMNHRVLGAYSETVYQYKFNNKMIMINE